MEDKKGEKYNRKLMKLLLLTFYLMFSIVILVGSISAFEFDNVKKFIDDGSRYGKIEIINSFGFGSTLAEYKLIKNTDQCLINCESRGSAILYSSGKLFDEIKFKSLGGDFISSNYKILLEQSETYQVEVPDFKEVCGQYDNKTNYCNLDQTGTHLEDRERIVWKEYNYDILPTGNYNWKVLGKKNLNQNIDWIGSALGSDFTEWAWWNSTWQRRKEVDITGGSSVLINFTIILNVTFDDEMQVDFDDLRFIDGACNGLQTDELTYEFDKRVNSNFALVWVKIPSLSTGTDNICMYYNNTLAVYNADPVNSWDKNYVAVWHFTEGSGIPTNDSLGNTHGNLSGATWNTTGTAGFGNAINFGGTFNVVNLTNSTQLQIQDPLTIEAWGNLRDTSATRIILAGETNLLGYTFAVPSADDSLKFGLVAGTYVAATDDIFTGDNHMVIAVNGSGNANFYLNKSLDAGSPQSISNTYAAVKYTIGGGDEGLSWLNTLDEIRISDIQRNQSWINRSRDNIDFSFFSFGPEEEFGGVLSTLLIPNDLANSTRLINFFQANVSGEGNLLDNATLHIWDSSDNLIATNSTLVNITTSIIVSFNHTLSGYDNYTWNVKASGSNGSEIAWGVNRTLFVKRFLEISQQFNTTTIEGSLERFVINFTYDNENFENLNGNLFYNNTKFPGTLSSSNGNAILSRSITIPDINSSETFNFYWEIVLNNGSDILQNSTTNSQIVNNISLDGCSSFGILLLNYSLKDEVDENFINGTAFNSTIEIDLQLFPLDSDIPIIQFSTNFSQNNTPQVCLENNLEGSIYRLDVETRYDADDYASEFHHIQKQIVTNSTLPININLFDLKDDDAQLFKISFKDSNFLAVADALIQIQRKYINQGVFKIVEIPLTDEQGESVASLQLNEVIYNIIIVKNGNVLGTFNNVIAECQNPTIQTCSIPLNSFATSIEPKDFTRGDDFTFTLSFEKSTRKVSSTFVIPSGNEAVVLLNVTLFDGIGGNQTCFSTITSTSGSLSCSVPNSIGNGTIIAKIFKAGVEQGNAFISLQSDPSEIYGTSIVFLGLFLILMMIGVGLSDNPMITGIFVLIGAFLLILFNIVNTGTSAFIGAGATILWLVIAIIIVLIKGSKRL